MMVKAMVMTGPGTLEMRELQFPDPPKGGAVIQVLANGVCGSDFALLSGEQKNPGGKPAPFPMIPGHEPVGRIVKIDEAARRNWGVSEGNRVVVESKARCGQCQACQAGSGACVNPLIYSLKGLSDPPGLWGGFAQYMSLVAGSSVFAVPDHVSDENATMFNPLGNAYYWVAETARVSPGDRVLILGAGQRGLCCAVAAREAGAAQIIVTGLSRDAAKLRLAPEFGATDMIVVDEEDTVDRVLEITAGAGVDVVIDTVPVAVSPLKDGVDSLRKGGRLVLAGVRPADAGPFPFERFRVKELSMLGVSGTTTTAVERAMTTIAAGRYPFGRLHSHVYGLSRTAEAIGMLGPPGMAAAETPIHVVVKPTLA